MTASNDTSFAVDRTMLHRMRNHLAGLAANVELAQVIAADLDGPEDLVRALAHALESCRDLRAAFDAIDAKPRG